eukprot:TRINITY_DN99318_c0_g1_i1.p1 TRINITY_DN99318_c0_g1~~TRINITY_DN99318_c0_g1_i1.p1  ORF type:complete len:210 (-),score=57.78 TRINITY_DN99318_c0_g1_i1:51-680(-)
MLPGSNDNPDSKMDESCSTTTAALDSTEDAMEQDAPKQPEEMTAEERSQFAAKCKDIGNGGFKKGDWEYANFAYQEGIRYLQYMPYDSQWAPKADFDHGGEDHLKKDSALAVTLFSNLAATMLKMDQPQQALGHSRNALAFEPNHVKSLFRAGQAHLALGEHELALEAADRILELEPGNSEATKLKGSAQRCEKMAREKQKAMCSKMFG